MEIISSAIIGSCLAYLASQMGEMNKRLNILIIKVGILELLVPKRKSDFDDAE